MTNMFDIPNIEQLSIQENKRHDRLNIKDIWQNNFEKEVSNIAPDTIGADYCFVEGFINDEMFMDFPAIEREFLKNCYHKMHTFEIQTQYGEKGVETDAPKNAIQKKIVTYMYNGAKSGDEYCLALIKYLYKTYHKKEYNQLKRFSVITGGEVWALAEIEEGLSYNGLGRILGMCSFLGIEMDRDCALIYLFLEKYRENVMDELEWYRTQGLDNVYSEETDESIDDADEDIFLADIERVEEIIRNTSKRDLRRIVRMEHKALDIIGKLFVSQGLPCNFLENHTPMASTESTWAKVLGVLKTLEPGEEITAEDIARYVPMLWLVEAMTDIFFQFEDEIETALGEVVNWEEDTIFNPEKIQLKQSNAIPIPERTIASTTAPIKMGDAKAEEYMEEINQLRKKLHEKEQENTFLRELYKNAKASQIKYENLQKEYENQREELKALRDFAYKSSKEIEVQKQESIEDMKKAIKNRKILIVGGHINWINKLQKNFPGWSIIPANASRTVDAKILDGIEKVYFFTDHLDHSNYGKYISICRDKHIPFGYLHVVNIDMMIQQVYEDIAD